MLPRTLYIAVCWIVVLQLLQVPLCAQSDTWQVYLSQYEKGPGSTLVNMSLRQDAPRADYPYVVLSVITLKNCYTNGLPAPGELDAVAATDSLLDVYIKQYAHSVHAGVFTYQCERIHYHYVKDTTGVLAQVHQAMQQESTSYQVVLRARPDTIWEAYLQFLYPNAETLDYLQNQQLVNQLLEAGDALEKTRIIEHWAYFPNEKARNCFITFLQSADFRIIEKTLAGDEELPFCVHFSRSDRVLLSEISQVTRTLHQSANRCKGIYDGWETPVVK